MKINCKLNKSIRAALGLGAVSLTVGMAFITPAQAAGTVQWTGDLSGDWSDGGNWDTSSTPNTGDDVLVTDNALTGNAVTNVNYADLGVGALNSVVVDGGSSSNITLNQNSYDLTTDTTLTVGDGGSGMFKQDNSQSDSSVNVGTDLILGKEAGSAGTYTVTDTGSGNTLSLTVSGDTIIGQAGTGMFNQIGGINTANGGFYIGGHGANTESGDGTYNLNSGTLNTGWQVVGDSGIGTFNQNGGDNNAGSLLLGNCGGCSFGVNTNSSGYYNLFDGNLNVAGDVSVSGFGYGELNQTGGNANIAADLVLGTAPAVGGTPPREGHYNLSGGVLKVSGNSIIGAGNGVGADPGFSSEPGGKGTFTQTGGDHQVTGGLIVGQGGNEGDPTKTIQGSDGIYNLSGNTSTLTTGYTRIGEDGTFGGTGVFNQSGGTHTTDLLYIGSGSGNGTYNLSGTGVLNVTGPNNGVAYISEGGTAQFTQSGSSQFTANYLNVGIFGGNASYNLNGGELIVNGNFNVGGNGTVTQTGGGVSAGDLNVDAGGIFNFQGGNLGMNGTWNNNGQANIQSTVPNDNLTVSGNVVNSGSFHVTETNVTYTDMFTNNGSYISDPAVNNFNDLTIGSSGYLVGGAGDQFVISGSLLNNSTQSTQWNTLQSSLFFNSSGSHSLTLAGTDVGASQSGYASNFAWGDLSLATGENLNLFSNNSGGNALYVKLFNLADGLNQLSQISSAYNIYYDPNLAGNSYLNDLKYQLNGGGFLTPVAVPIPAALWLFGSALAGFTLSSRRKTTV